MLSNVQNLRTTCRICEIEDETVVNRLNHLHKNIIYKLAQLKVRKVDDILVFLLIDFVFFAVDRRSKYSEEYL